VKRLGIVLLIAIACFSDQNVFKIAPEHAGTGKNSDMLLNEYGTRKNESKFLYNLGKSLMEEGKHEKALPYSREAYVLSPKDPWILYLTEGFLSIKAWRTVLLHTMRRH
jgi:tetratricopeptide (TPR) repeat protein